MTCKACDSNKVPVLLKVLDPLVKFLKRYISIEIRACQFRMRANKKQKPNLIMNDFAKQYFVE